MKTRLLVSTLALATSLGWALPAQAQSPDAAAAIRAELQAMRQQMEALEAKVDTLESQLAEARARADAASAAAAQIPAPSVTAKPPTTITWDGAPRIEAAVDPKDPQAGRWSFKPRGRLQLDSAVIKAPDAVAGNNSLGLATEIRRAYLGFDGTLPGNLAYRAEIDVADSAVRVTDLYVTYKPNPDITLTLGHHKPFLGIEEMTSDLFISFLERAAFTTAFTFERRIGASGQYAKGPWLVQAGVFTDNANDLTEDANNSYSIDGRVVFAPSFAGGTLHLGGSAHYREFNDLSLNARYATRPFFHSTDLQIIDTRLIRAAGEHHFGAEFAYVAGPLHVTAEGHRMTARRPGLPDPTFWGGYAEIGYLLTGEMRTYKAGAYERIRPTHGFDKGGWGALEINARYDHLDLNSRGILGGRQQIAGLSLVWIPSDFVRFLVNYGHIWFDDAAVPAGADRDYAADALGMRAQFDF